MYVMKLRQCWISHYVSDSFYLPIYQIFFYLTRCSHGKLGNVVLYIPLARRAETKKYKICVIRSFGLPIVSIQHSRIFTTITTITKNGQLAPWPLTRLDRRLPLLITAFGRNSLKNANLCDLACNRLVVFALSMDLTSTQIQECASHNPMDLTWRILENYDRCQTPFDYSRML